MKNKILLSISLLLILLFGCIQVNQETPKNEKTTEPINNTFDNSKKSITNNETKEPEIQKKSVSIVDDKTSLSYSSPTEVSLTTVRSTIIIKPNSNIVKITISGSDSLIKLPKEAQIDIEETGVRNTIERY